MDPHHRPFHFPGPSPLRLMGFSPLRLTGPSPLRLTWPGPLANAMGLRRGCPDRPPSASGLWGPYSRSPHSPRLSPLRPLRPKKRKLCLFRKLSD